MEDYFRNSDDSELFEEDSFSKEEIPADEELYEEDLTTFGGVENFLHKKVQHGKLLIWTRGDHCNTNGSETQKTKKILDQL